MENNMEVPVKINNRTTMIQQLIEYDLSLRFHF